jgi:hypothetical protein
MIFIACSIRNYSNFNKTITGISLRDYRERRSSTTSMEIQQPKRREKRVNRQTFYPLPSSFSEPDNYEYSEDGSEEDSSSLDGDVYNNTLVSNQFLISF